MLFNGQPLRQNLFAQRIEQEGRFTVDRAAGNRSDQVTKQPGRHFVGENDRRLHGRQLTRRQARQGAAGALFPDPFRGLQILDRPANGVGVVALHIAIIFRDDAAGERMASRAVTLQHAVTVTEHFDAVVTVKAAAFGVGDAFIGLQRRLLRAGGQFDGFVRGDLRRVEQVQIRGVKGQQLFIGHTGKRIRGGVARNIQRRLYGAGDGVRVKIGGRGAALAVLMVNRNA